MTEVDRGEIEVRVINDGKRVVVALVGTPEGRTVMGTAHRDPADRYDASIGSKLALGRALRDLGRNYLKEANREVRRQAALRQQESVLMEQRAKVKKDRDRRAKEAFKKIRNGD